MPTLAESLRPLVNGIRAIPGQLGLRPYSVAIVVGTWAGAYVGRDSKTETAVAITEANGQPPKVRFLNAEEIAVGGLQKGSCAVGPITPAFPGGGTLFASLKPALTNGQTVHARIIGPEFPDGGLFKVTAFDTDHAIHYMLTCEPVELTPAP
jgi:hypothetical protein